MSEHNRKRRHFVGPTHKFPRGKLNSDDEGELQIAIAADAAGEVVRIDFGKRIAWLALPAEQARQLAAMLTKHADSLERAGG